MGLNVTLDLTSLLENIFIEQKGKKQVKSIKELKLLLQELGALKASEKKKIVKKKKNRKKRKS